MEFIPESQTSAIPESAKNIYPCLAHIHVIPSSDPKAARRLSTGSFNSDDGNPLTRVISGGARRRTSFGPTAGTDGSGRRLSFGGNKEGKVESGHFAAKDDEKNLEGKWYWRVQAGVTDTHLILLPLTQPPNPVLTSAPGPLSHAMPAHSAHVAAGTRTEGGGGATDEDTGLVAKMKGLFRRSSTTNANKDTSQTINEDAKNTNAFEGVQERVIDQTSRGEMLPSAKGNEIGATNVNSTAELGYPGVINGDKLGGVVIPLQAIEKSKVVFGGGKKGEGSWVTVPITSHFSHFVQPMLEGGVGSNKPESFPKSGYIKFEFDKDWIGAKGEAELLHHHITKAVSSLPDSKERQPHLTQFHLGGGPGHKHHSPTLPQTREVGPNDESAIAEDEDLGPTGGSRISSSTGGGDIAAGATGHQGIALGHPVAERGPGGSVGSSTSGKVGGE
ncbi:uncharacterized protein IL334_005287 [Kwoniella shivajii]|uniref:Cytoplasmic protein n=1 Tax=Kwoniella shivajii TaxID=564305 RepID=A0ABZ1D379_9TREE|nr:hypothetical protein IL334_005287 [Kwoniella shivajii]